MAVKNRQPTRTYDTTYAVVSKPADLLQVNAHLLGQDALHVNAHLARADALHGGDLPGVLLHYDYTQVAEEHRADVIARAQTIKRHERRTVESMLTIGRELAAVQDKLPHGQFLPWIEQEFGWQRSTAYNILNLAAKFPTVGNLPVGIGLSALYQLSAAPDSALQEATLRQAQGETITKAKATAIATRHRDAQKQLTQEEQTPPQLPPAGVPELPSAGVPAGVPAGPERLPAYLAQAGCTLTRLLDGSLVARYNTIEKAYPTSQSNHAIAWLDTQVRVAANNDFTHQIERLLVAALPLIQEAHAIAFDAHQSANATKLAQALTLIQEVRSVYVDAHRGSPVETGQDAH